MISTILVPLDGSRFAEAALAPAAYLARTARARLYLTTAHSPAAVMVGMGELALFPSGLEDDVRREEDGYLAEASSGLAGMEDGQVRHSLVDGSPGEAVCDEAGVIGADLIVMATHGRGAMGRLWLGGVADHVVRRSGRPVLLIHPHRTLQHPAETGFRNILVALDPSDYSESVLDPVVTLASITGADVTLLTVIAPVFGIAEPEMPPPLPQHPSIIARRSDEAHARLDQVASDLTRRDIPTRTRVIIAPTPAGGILRVLEEARFDMLAMATHGRSGVERLLVGSVAEKVMRAAPKPLLIYHPAFA